MSFVKVVCNGFDSSEDAQEFCNLLCAKWNEEIFGFEYDASIKEWKHNDWKKVMDKLPLYDWNYVYLADLIHFEEIQTQEKVDISRMCSDELLQYALKALNEFDLRISSTKSIGSLCVSSTEGLLSLSFWTRTPESTKIKILEALNESGFAYKNKRENEYLVGTKSSLEWFDNLIKTQANRAWYDTDRSVRDSF